MPAPAGAAPEPRIAALIEPQEAEIYAALSLGLRDYVAKNGSSTSSWACPAASTRRSSPLAADALGAGPRQCRLMPSVFSSGETQADARSLAARLGVSCSSYRSWAGRAPWASSRGRLRRPRADLAEENLQARIRGNLLMALSNKFGWLVLTTGNKSEMSVGYSTLYGDLAGASP